MCSGSFRYISVMQVISTMVGSFFLAYCLIVLTFSSSALVTPADQGSQVFPDLGEDHRRPVGDVGNFLLDVFVGPVGGVGFHGLAELPSGLAHGGQSGR